jgi:hypothetical protein
LAVLGCLGARAEEQVREDGLNAFTVPHSPFDVTAAFMHELRALNISHLASFYGFDEYNGNMSAIAAAFAPLKAAFPEVLTLTTAHVGTQYGALVPHPVEFGAECPSTISPISRDFRSISRDRFLVIGFS